MKGSQIAAHEQAEKVKEPKSAETKAEEKKDMMNSKDCYCGEASKRFPHLTNGENRGVKPPKEKLANAFKEVYANEPSTVTRANVHGEQKRKMLAAIAYSKAGESRGKHGK